MILRQGAVPKEYPFLNLVTDVSKKASKCGLCHKVIPKGSTRFSISYRRSYIKYSEKVFMHQECIGQFINGENLKQKCDDCETVCDPRTLTRLTLISGNSYQYNLICEYCLMKKSYRLCMACTSLYPRFYVSKIVMSFDHNPVLHYRPNYPSDAMVCNSCAQEWNYDTINTIRMREKADAFVNERYLKIMTDLADGNFFGDSDE